MTTQAATKTGPSLILSTPEGRHYRSRIDGTAPWAVFDRETFAPVTGPMKRLAAHREAIRMCEAA